MGHSLEGSRIEVMVWDHCNVGYVARIILREIVRKQYRGGRPRMYSVEEVQTIGDVG